jgi:tetratricopeptide (TPR) repeat protein
MELAVDFGSFGDLLEVAAGPELLDSVPDGPPVEGENPGPEVAAADESAEDQSLYCGEPAEEFALVDESLPDPEEVPSAADLSAGLFPEEEIAAVEEEPEPPFDREETESQYNLGIAYKEMGLLDKALAEFAAAAANPERRVACLILQAVCYRDKGDLTRAVHLLEECIAAGKAQDDELLDLTFELALTHEGSGQEEIALDLYRSIRNRTPDYRDVGRRIARLLGEDEDDPVDFALEDLEILEE